jgi:hypothetical protein
MPELGEGRNALRFSALRLLPMQWPYGRVSGVTRYAAYGTRCRKRRIRRLDDMGLRWRRKR